MTADWAVVFTAAGLFTLLTVPMLRRLALAIDFVDHPAARKIHTSPIPYLGGVAIAVGTLGGLLLGGEVAVRMAVIAIAGSALAVVGLLDDRRTLHPAPRLTVQVLAALAAVFTGVQLHVTGMPVYDFALTVVWIVAITNALNLMDNMDGLTGGVGLMTGVGVLVLALGSGQTVIVGAAAGLAGACTGFLAYNARPANIFMGDAGALFIGFFLAILAIEVTPAVAPPGSWVVPALFLALPMLDTTTVVLARMRRRKKVFQGAKDHLSHRLVARGVAPGWAVSALVLAQALLVGLGVVAGRDLLGVPVALALGGIVIGGITVLTARARVYDRRVRGFSRRARTVFASFGLLLTFLTVPPAVAMAASAVPLHRGATLAQEGLDAARAGDVATARARFAAAGGHLSAAEWRLSNPAVRMGTLVPVLAPNLDAARAMAEVARDLARTGHELTAAADPERLGVRQGTVPLDEVERLAPLFDDAVATLTDARRRFTRLNRSYLLPPVAWALADAEDRVVSTLADAELAADAARVAPALLGSDGPRRYFLAVQNPAEARATGGFIGNWGVLLAEDGRLRLETLERITVLNHGIGEAAGAVRTLRAPEEYVARYGRFDIESTWQNVNMSPDVPTVGAVVADQFEQSGGGPVDGVVFVDPVGLAALLELTGPVQVPDWPTPITAENVVDVTLRDAYAAFDETDERVEFLGLSAEAVADAFTTRDLGRPMDIAAALSPAVRGGHLRAYFVREGEQGLAERVGLAGVFPPPVGDSLHVTTQNAAGNKTDYYLRRHLAYTVQLEPVPGVGDVPNEARFTGTLDVVLENQAPSEGLPRIVIGPYDERFSPGENRSFVSVYSPHAFRGATFEGRPTGLEVGSERGHQVFSGFLSLLPGGTHDLALELEGTVELTRGGWYRLDLHRQPLPAADEVTVRVELSPGWRVVDLRGLESDGLRAAAASFQLREPVTLGVRIERERSWLDRLLGIDEALTARR